MTETGWLSPELLRDAEMLRREDLSVDPVLACAFDVPAGRGAEAATWAQGVVARWSVQARRALFGFAPLPGDLPHEAAATLFTNAMALWGLLAARGRSREERERAAEAERRLNGFLSTEGLVPVVRLFCAMRAYEHGRALSYYGRMTEGDFTSGRLHLTARPEYGYGDLLYGVVNGWLRLEREGADADAETVVRLTAAGEEIWGRLEGVMQRSGVLAERERLLQCLQWWSMAETYAELLDRLAPAERELRAAFFIFTGISPGMRVLDVGSGHGAGVTTEGGLAQLVGARGQVYALDRQRFSLERLSESARRQGLRHVRTVVAAAERNGLANGSVDAVTSQAALHFMDVRAFMQEAWRTLRPGGVVGVTFPVGLGSPFLAAVQDAVVAALPAGVSGQAMVLCDPEAVSAEMRRVGFRDLARQDGQTELRFAEGGSLACFLLNTVRYLGAGLGAVPWTEQLRLRRAIEGVVAGVVETFPPERRVVAARYSMVRGRKPAVDVVYVVGPDIGLGRDGAIYRAGRLLLRTPACGKVLRALAEASGPLSADALAARAGGLSVQTVYNAIRALRARLSPALTIVHVASSGYQLRRGE